MVKWWEREWCLLSFYWTDYTFSRITFLLTYSKLEYIITNIEVNKMFINLFKIRVYHPKYSKSWISVGKSFPELHVTQCFQDIQ